jgi:hypothetical protein
MAEQLARVDRDAIPVHHDPRRHRLEVAKHRRRKKRQRPGRWHRPPQQQRRVLRKLRLPFDARRDVHRRHQPRAGLDLDGHAIVRLRLHTHGRDLRMPRKPLREQPVDERVTQRNLARQRRPRNLGELDASARTKDFGKVQEIQAASFSRNALARSRRAPRVVRASSHLACSARTKRL